MRRASRTVAALAAVTIGAGATAAAGLAAPAGAQNASDVRSAKSVASAPGSGQLVVDWTKELLQIQKTPGAQRQATTSSCGPMCGLTVSR
jgi:hypothetical protein